MAINTFESLTSHGGYNLEMSTDEHDARLYGSLAAFTRLPSLGTALGVDPQGISGLHAENRVGAVRSSPGTLAGENDQPTSDQSSLIKELGELEPLDHYFIVSNESVNHGFGGEFTDAGYTSMFLHNSLHVRTFVTQARFDGVVYSPSFPICFERLPEVDHVEVDDAPSDPSPRPERMTIHFKPGAFPPSKGRSRRPRSGSPCTRRADTW